MKDLSEQEKIFQDLCDKLAGKYIVFVEDNIKTIAGTLRKLDKLGGEDWTHKHTKHFKTLESAETFFQKKLDECAVISIDLNIPPIPESLDKYVKQLDRIKLNEGQTLGLFLDKKNKERMNNGKAKIPYFYFTALPSELDEYPEGQDRDSVRLVYKRDISPADFSELLLDILNDGEDAHKLKI